MFGRKDFGLHIRFGSEDLEAAHLARPLEECRANGFYRPAKPVRLRAVPMSLSFLRLGRRRLYILDRRNLIPRPSGDLINIATAKNTTNRGAVPIRCLREPARKKPG
jgi:hypothetical protein